MFSLIAQLLHKLRPLRTAIQYREEQCVAHALMESAESRAGLDPRAACELRAAARAYLSVVR
ncbi:hypothetical protein PY257_01775 [Ramlibacter sp. H39-3-26]|uniref:hypothetical protein n=1 Tax=Curvibacter soli TaxID=3031331 RepID=UPI0023DC8553|nr:hypothetical protein [Ramlibacter sp. H39-3-26]MDF1483925.1 hypothetical protein [Ramlibacter sp. H39-3-26]